jgi:hypothetical protein
MVIVWIPVDINFSKYITAKYMKGNPITSALILSVFPLPMIPNSPQNMKISLAVNSCRVSPEAPCINGLYK